MPRSWYLSWISKLKSLAGLEAAGLKAPSLRAPGSNRTVVVAVVPTDYLATPSLALSFSLAWEWQIPNSKLKNLQSLQNEDKVLEKPMKI